MSNYAVVEDGKVTNIVVWDGETKWLPENGDAILAPEGVGIGWTYVDGIFTAPVVQIPDKTHDELVADAEAEKSARLDEAKSKIVIWQTKMLMGRTLTSKESASLNEWVDYIDAVSDIDTSTAPDIDWPQPPEA